MLRSLFSAVTGMRSHQTAMDVIGNNIANVNTAGYKSSQTQFQDTLSQALRSGGAGVNPAQVGLGVQVAGIATNFSQGSAQTTNRPSDLMISGDGFFVVQQGGGQVYSRAGAFSLDGSGNLTSPNGGVVQGWPAVDGVINTGTSLSGLSVPTGLIMAPAASSAVDAGGNLSADAAVGATVVNGIDIFDQTGRSIPVTLTYTKTGTDTWTADATVAGSGGATTTVGSATLSWDSTTMAFTPGSVAMTNAALASAGYVFPGDVTVDLGGDGTPLTQYAGASTATLRGQDGAAAGQLQSWGVGTDGVITGSFSNGRTQSLGQVALAFFGNPEGLEKAGDSAFRVSAASGQPAIGVPGTGGRGSIAAGRLEMSNVDLAQEFTNLVMIQRGFQANSRVVTASDEILQDLVNLKR